MRELFEILLNCTCKEFEIEGNLTTFTVENATKAKETDYIAADDNLLPKYLLDKPS